MGMISTSNNPRNRTMDYGEPFVIDVSDAAVAVGTGQTYNVPLPAHYIYKIKGIEVTVAGNQLFEGLFIGSAVAANRVIPAKTQRGAGVHLSKNQPIRYRQFPLSLSFAAAGGGAGVNIIDDFEFPMGVTLRRAYWNAGTGTGAVAFTVTVTVGAGAAQEILNNLGANAVQLENENININIPPDTDVLVEFNDAGVATANQNLVLWFEINEEQVEFESQEYIPLTFFYGAIVGAATVNMMDDFEMPEGLIIKRAYAQVGTAAGGGNTSDFYVNGVDLGLTITDPAVFAENENLNIPLPPDVDHLITLTCSGGVATDHILILWCQRSTPIKLNEQPPDVQDVYGDVYVNGNQNLVVQYDQGTTLQSIRTKVYGSKMFVKN